MADDSANTTTESPARTRNRRSSFAGQTLADLFGTGRSNTQRTSTDNGANSSPPTQQLPGPISQAAAQAQRRRLSLTTFGPGSAPGSTSPYNSYRGARRDSISSANSGSIDESAIEDDVGPANNSTPTTPFARRMSFGARALMDVRTSSGGSSGGGGPNTGQNGTKSPPAPNTASAKAQNGTISSRDGKGRGLSTPVPHHPRHRYTMSLPFTPSLLTGAARIGSADFWNENMRTRAERTSIGSHSGGGMPVPAAHARAQSVATMEQPIREMPAAPKQDRKPDHFQERILKGDFYMD
ncbi:hypothetical protein LTR36_007082 [Oleoguttula mirabilis]|uniref:Uncharacterized protein n=1 Tax=Oleoguttula mirabilis TaxID=1507867 RepID=A0AAV9JAV7_9PEZI|nr:hypothetical protein LTR36_007082 [Oleoguttula mirabilis]